jgi:hypothetical protein
MKILTFLFIFLFVITSGLLASDNSIQIGIDFHYESITTELIDFDYMQNSISQEITGEDISNFNDIHRFENSRYNTGVNLYYSIFDDLKIFTMLGISFVRHTSYIVDGDVEDHSFANISPGYYYGAGFSYSHNIYDKLSAKFNPQISYTVFKDMRYSDPNNDSEDLDNVLLEHYFLFYTFPLQLQYDFGLFKPGIGICFFNYVQDVKYNGTFIDDFGEETYIKRNYEFQHNSMFGGILNLEIQINEVTHIFIDAVITDGYAANLRFQFDL